MVGCNTLLLPAGWCRSEVVREVAGATQPARHAGPPSPASRFETPDGPRLIPGLAASVILPVADLWQIRIAAATACLIRARGATARRERWGPRPRAPAATMRGLTLIWERHMSSTRAAKLIPWSRAAPALRARVELPAANQAEAAPRSTDYLRNHGRCARPIKGRVFARPA